MIYIGLLLVSKNIFDKYLPIIPSTISCNPPKNKITVTRLAQPDTLPSIVNFLTTTNKTPINDKIKENVPAQNAIFKGASEKLTRPS